MPVMDGIEAARIINLYSAHKNMKVVILGLTGQNEESIYSRCADAGIAEICKHYTLIILIVIKPLGFQAVEESIKKYKVI